MMPSKISVTANNNCNEAVDNPSAFRKLVKNYNMWITETFQIDNVENDGESKPSLITDIGSLFIPIVKYLRIIGFCPFAIRQADHQTGYVFFEFKWKSWLTVYSTCLSVSFGIFAISMFLKFLWISFAYEFVDVLKFQGYDIKLSGVPQNISRVSEIGTRLVPATFPLFSTTSVVGTLSSLPKFHVLLNQWSLFQRQYIQAFPERKDDPFIALRQYRNGTFTIFPFAGAVAIAVVFSVIENFWGGTGQLFPTEGLPRFTATFTMLIMVGGHGCHFLMFRTLMEAFKQIHVGIRMWRNDTNQPNESCEHYLKKLQERFKNWTNIVLLAKKQVEITSNAIALHHVSTIFINFIYLCLGVFSFLSSKLGSAEGNRGYILLMFWSWGFSLLTVKAFMCEKIVAEEKRIVEALRQVEVNDYVPAQIQINSLIDIIIQEPAVVRFWDVFTLNKSFLVQLVGQVATYLIVLIQFDNVGAKA